MNNPEHSQNLASVRIVPLLVFLFSLGAALLAVSKLIVITPATSERSQRTSDSAYTIDWAAFWLLIFIGSIVVYRFGARVHIDSKLHNWCSWIFVTLSVPLFLLYPWGGLVAIFSYVLLF